MEFRGENANRIVGSIVSKLHCQDGSKLIFVYVDIGSSIFVYVDIDTWNCSRRSQVGEGE